MTDKDVIERLGRLLGGTISHRPKERDPKATKDVWDWRLYQREAVVAAIQKLLPHMGSRRTERIKEMLEYNETHPKRPYNRNQENGRYVTNQT